MIKNTFPIPKEGIDSWDMWTNSTSRHRLTSPLPPPPSTISPSIQSLLTTIHTARASKLEYLPQGCRLRLLPCKLNAQVVPLSLHLVYLVLELLDPVDLLLAVFFRRNVVPLTLGEYLGVNWR